jgi:hypothetical protein
MKIKELFEDKKNYAGISDAAANALSNGKHYSQMDSNYELYRFGVSMAGQPGNPDVPMDKEGVGETPVIFAFSKGEEEIINATEKLRNMKGKQIGPKGSKELKDANTTSPVAKPKRNKYGV